MGWRVAYVAFCLIGFAAVMLGLRYLLTGFGEPFGAGIAYGGLVGITSVALVVDRDQRHFGEQWVPVAAFVVALAAATGFGHSLTKYGLEPALLIGTAIGFVGGFALLYWTNGMDRAKRGDPRRPYRN